VLGSLFSRIAEIQKALDLSEASFGLALTGVPAGASRLVVLVPLDLL